LSHYIIAKGVIEWDLDSSPSHVTIRDEMKRNENFYDVTDDYNPANKRIRIEFEMGETNGISYDPLDSIKDLCIGFGLKNIEIFTNEYVENQGGGYHFDNLEDSKNVV